MHGGRLGPEVEETDQDSPGLVVFLLLLEEVDVEQEHLARERVLGCLASRRPTPREEPRGEPFDLDPLRVDVEVAPGPDRLAAAPDLLPRQERLPVAALLAREELDPELQEPLVVHGVPDQASGLGAAQELLRRAGGFGVGADSAGGDLGSGSQQGSAYGAEDQDHAGHDARDPAELAL